MMKLTRKTYFTFAFATALATIAIAAYTTATRLRDGGTTGVGYVAYATDSGIGRFAFLKKNTSGFYQVYVAGTGITGDQLASSGVYTATRPAISRDGKIVTFWGRRSLTDAALRAYYFVVGTSTPVTPTVNLSTTLNGTDNVGVWPPQPSNVSGTGTFKILFVDRMGYAAPIESNCTVHAGNAYWKTGQLYSWAGGTSAPVIVSTAGFNVNGCQYLVTQSPGDMYATSESPAQIDTYTIDSSGSRVSWSTAAINHKVGISQNYQQIVLRDDVLGTRELISRNAAGVEGNGNSSQQSSTGDVSKFAFASTATNLTSFTGDLNGFSDIFRRDRTANTTIAAYDLALNNTETLSDGPSFYPSISGDGAKVAFHSYSTSIRPYSTTKTPPYAIGGTAYAFLSTFLTNPGTVELESYKVGAPTDWRAGIFPSVNFAATKYGFHSADGDLASPTQASGYSDIYELN